MRFKISFDDEIAGDRVDSPVDGGLQQDAVVHLALQCPLAFPDRVDDPGIFRQGLAGLQQRFALAQVHVEHAHAHLDVRGGPQLRGEGVGQVQVLGLRPLVRAVVEHHQLRHRQLDQRPAVFVLPVADDVALVHVAGVLQQPHRHVGVVGRLLLVQVHQRRDQEGHVVVHAKIKRLPYGRQLDQRRVGITCMVDRVVQAQCPLRVRLAAEDEIEQPVAVILPSRRHPNTSPSTFSIP